MSVSGDEYGPVQDQPPQSQHVAESVAVREVVWAELLACYGEGEDTDWPYLEDLATLVADLAVRHAHGRLIDGPT